jgi:16S rRNA (guanine(966)-N(2))-methyltransferase RsmD
MRITTGIYKGRGIRMPAGIRPTQNITRKAIFDILGDIQGLLFLELYAGSGAVGIEAVSRGAKEAVFVENNHSVLKVLIQNLSYLPQTKYYIMPIDALVAIKRLAEDGRKIDVIFLDPPYCKGEDSLAKKTLQTLGAYDILSPTGLIIAQHPKKESLPEHLGVLTLLKLSTYGTTVLSFYKKNP